MLSVEEEEEEEEEEEGTRTNQLILIKNIWQIPYVGSKADLQPKRNSFISSRTFAYFLSITRLICT